MTGRDLDAGALAATEGLTGRQGVPAGTTVILDTNVYDEVEKDEAATAAFTAPDRGMQVLATHLQRDQIGRAPHAGRLLALLKHTDDVVTSGAVWGVSRWGHASWGRLDEDALVRDMVGNAQGVTNRLKDAVDGLIAATALAHHAVLVTQDTTMTKRAQRAGVDVWDWPTFRERLLAG